MNWLNPQRRSRKELSFKEKDALDQLTGYLAKRILTQLKPEIVSGEIGTVIGIDGSGRLPALLLSKVIKSSYKELGHSPIQTRFFRGEIKSKNELKKALDEHPLDKQRTVLIADDTLSEGTSTQRLIKELKRRGYKTKLASMGIAGSKNGSNFKGVKKKFGDVIFADDSTIPLIYKQYNISGVVKGDGDVLYGHPYAEHDVDEEQVLKKMGAARDHLNEVAKRLTKEIILDSK